LCEWESEGAWLAAGAYVLPSPEWQRLEEISERECLSAFRGYKGNGVSLADLPSYNDVVELVIKRVTVDDIAEFDEKSQAFYDHYVADFAYNMADFEGVLNKRLRLNVNFYPQAKALLGVGLAMAREPAGWIQHFATYDFECTYITYKIE